MDSCEYSEILQNDIEIKQHGKNTDNWKPLMRQCIVTSGVCCMYFLQGLFLGAPTVLVAQIRKDVNSTEIITDEMLSWLTTTPMLSSQPFVVVLPLLFNRIGRKFTFMCVCLVAIVGWVIFYISTNLYHVLISELCAGAITATVVTISPVIIAEYTSPKYRGTFLAMKGSTSFWGIWMSNAIGTFFYWKNIAIVAFVCSVYLLSVMTWPESPYWLAKRGLYEESAKSHRWLKGVNEDSEKELKQLINAQKNINNAPLEVTNNHNFGCISALSGIWTVITTRPFYKPVVISALLFAQYNCTGKFVISMYAIDILKHLSPNQSFVYKAMLALDGVTVFSMYVGCIIARYFRRKILLLLFSGAGILILFILSFYLYLASLSIIFENDVVILLLLILFSIAISCGPMILCTSIYGEIMPPRYQDPAMMCVGTIAIVVMSVFLKLSPFLFKSLKMHGCFLFFAISSTVFLLIVYIILPETKDKTIQDIEDFFTETHIRKENNKTKSKDINFELHDLINKA